MKPTIGRIVHYTNLGAHVAPAMITEVNDDGTVTLHVFYKNGQVDLPRIERAKQPAGSVEAEGKWQWPDRES